MKSDRTLALIGEAKRGDRGAWSKVLERYYDRWLHKYHGDLGSTVGRLYDTRDLVQSAVGDAIRDIPDLRSEAAFFSWVTSIIRHKVAQRRRELEREPRESNWEDSASPGLRLPDRKQSSPAETVARLDSYTKTLEAILELFPEYPEPMAAVNMMFLDGCTIEELIDRFGKSRSSVYRWLEKGISLLRVRMET